MIADIKKRALHHSKILQGQMRGLEKMIESEAYCLDIITQSLAVQRSLRSLNKLVLENHLKTHIVEKFDSEDPALRKEATEELLGLFEVSNIRR